MTTPSTSPRTDAKAAGAPPGPIPVHRTRFSSADEDEVTGFIAQMYAEHSTRFAPLTDGAHFSALTHDVPALGADRVRTSIDYRGTSEQGFSDYVFFLVHAGSVHLTTPATEMLTGPGDVSFYPLNTPVGFSMRGFDVTTVRLPAAQLDDVASQVLEAGAVHFEAITPVSGAMARYWRSLLRTTAGALIDPCSPMSSPLLAAEAARALATAALHVFPNATTARPNTPGSGWTAPATVRRAVAHIEAHAHEAVTLQQIAAAAGTSARALQYAFRQHLGTTPLGHLRRVRLELARRELQRAEPTSGASADPTARVSVAAVAARWGFSNAGRFSAAYREAFGEAPGTTLRR